MENSKTQMSNEQSEEKRENETKRQKLSENSDDGVNDDNDDDDDAIGGDFVFDRVLLNNTREKRIVIAGKSTKPTKVCGGESNGDDVIAVLQKSAFNPEHTALLLRHLNETVFSASSRRQQAEKNKESQTDTKNDDDESQEQRPAMTQLVLRNDIYSTVRVASECLVTPHGTDFSSINLIHPATAKHFAKFVEAQLHLVEESGELFRTQIWPEMTSSATAFSLQWVYNALDGVSETDRVIYRDPHPQHGFILLADEKWMMSPPTQKNDDVAKQTGEEGGDGRGDGGHARENNLREMHILAICNRRDVASLRFLDASHLPLLRNIWGAGMRAVSQRFGIAQSQLRAFLHYPPSFLHLHAHVHHLMGGEAGGGGVGVPERNHSLHTVLENVARDGAHYRDATLLVPVRSADPIYSKFIALERESAGNEKKQEEEEKKQEEEEKKKETA